MQTGEWNAPVSTSDLVQNRQCEGEYKFDYATYPALNVTDGDVWMMVGAGGGGWGDVLEREPQAVVDDLRAGVITHQTAQDIYKVAYDSESLMADIDQTEELRAQARTERKNLGKPYSEFVKDWEQQRPPENALKYFGEFPGQVA